MHQRRNKIAPILFWLFAIAWAMVLFVFSGQNANESGELSAWATRIIFRIFPRIPLEFETLHFYVRKAAHFSIFALEGFLLGGALMLTLRKWKWIGGIASAALCAGMAVLNEYHQSFAEGRSCEVRDMIIDSAGAVTGVLLIALILWLVYRKRRKNNVII